MRNLIFLSILVLFSTCSKINRNSTKEKTDRPQTVNVPGFSADSAFQYVKAQVDFGPRVPNSPSHKACGEYLMRQLKSMGAEVFDQNADLYAFDGKVLKSKNIIGSYNPESKMRVLLFAHWDTRPWADQDKNAKNHQTPIDGANDGASGVGVLLEMARQFGKQKPPIGVDIIFFDAEDYGAPEALATSENMDSWCLGSQYWAKNKHLPGYQAKYGILLDMVGAPHATFYREQISDNYAKYVVDNVWNMANALGYGSYFINQAGGGITDDHVYINQIAGIPSIDIIHYNPNSSTGFGAYWHTLDDTMKNVDKNTLSAVGNTLLHVVYNEMP